MKTILYLMLIFSSLSGMAQTKQKPGVAEPPILSDSYLTGETWPVELLATDVDQYVTNRMADHRRFIDHVFANLEQYQKPDPERSEEHREQAASFFYVRGAETPRRVDLATALNQLTSMYFSDDQTSYGYKSRLLGVGFPIDQLVHLDLPLEETLSQWLEAANRQAAGVLARPFDQSTDAQIRAYIKDLNEHEWAAKTHWLIVFLERFSPEARATLLRFVSEYVVPETNAVFRVPQASPYLIKDFRRSASYAHNKYCWPPTKDLGDIPSEIPSANGDYLEWISAERFAEYLFNDKKSSNQDFSNHVDQLKQILPEAVKRGRSMNLPEGCDLLSDFFPYYQQKSMEEVALHSAAVFIGRVTRRTPGFSRNLTLWANSLLDVEVVEWLRKPEGEPGTQYQVMSGYADFKLGPYQVCSRSGRYQEIPVNSLVLVFSSNPPLGVGGTLLLVKPNQLLLLDEENHTTRKSGDYDAMKLSLLKSILVSNPYNKNDPAEVHP